jgi:hypothetical protein
MKAALYSARIGDSCSLGDDISYDALLAAIVDFTIAAAKARCVDDCDWEHEELRRKGLAALQVFRNGKALWCDSIAWDEEVAEARRERSLEEFEQRNEFDANFYDALNCELLTRWRHAGYAVRSLQHCMRTLFAELERDAAERASEARAKLFGELARQMQESS